MLPVRALVIFLSCSMLYACSVGPASMGQKPNPTPTPIMQAFIKHVVIIIQENRTVDNLFNGFSGADTVTTGRDSHGNVVHLTPRRLWQQTDPDHSHRSFLAAYNGGQMNGFDLVPNQNHVPLYSYSYTDPAQVQTYWKVAKSYAFADRMFQSNSGPSFPAHLYLIASQSPYAAENPDASPWGCDAPSGTTVTALNQNGQEYTYGFPCFDFPTLADEMDATGVSWRYYTPSPTGIWSAFDAIAHIRRGPDWVKNIAAFSSYTPAADFAAGNVPSVTWVVPEGFNSDHPNNVGDHGPDWVASLVNALGQGPDWNSTAVFIVWDDWGGWYDHVAPSQLDVMGLGLRVPLIVVSPYARQGYVSHVDHEFGSIMRFAEETFALPTMSTADRRADDLLDCFDFGKPPRPFSPFASLRPPAYSGSSIVSDVPADNE